MTDEDIASIQIDIESWAADRLHRLFPLFSAELSPPCGTPYAVLGAAMDRGQTDFHIPALIEPLGSGCDHVVERRREFLNARQIARVRRPKGRWLLYSPDWADFCQLAHDPGFVDESDAPAWDLWARWTRQNILVSWVPKALVNRYDEATQLSPCGTVCWADDKHIVDTRGRGFALQLLRSA